MALTGTPTKSVLKGRDTKGVQTRNIFYADMPIAVGVGMRNAWTTFYNRLLDANYLAEVSQNWQAYAHEDYHWDGSTWQPLGETSLSKVGTSNGQMMPATNSPCLIAKTSTKRTFGRKFLPGATENYGADGELASAIITWATAALNNWITTWTQGADTMTPAIWSKTNVLLEIVGGVVCGVIGTQVRRKIGRGI